ncbi:MAG: hypothetical protein COU90_00360 [Candidatus Ryanbacteria bacterium CG10_big_fil_rev_8_21_14_0_10_43_42]|uniref:PilN domain-containing protein n=1 Tax=Candidatus Ryanbacteria bacterium CG10_big_fil_rev_8_21_14_0_10_43_42 TaxID=1974864 RepID=A0A2M8KXV1_9BACT|nr:MAG: hypothetical protein COU90_00360 [Candidatus Ryanbacteria bacterium CG10_big_fil_rev_8_21_14_0_10_43_42]
MADPTLISKMPSVGEASPRKQRSVSGGMGVFTMLSLVFFILMGLAYGGVFLYKRSIESNLDGLTRQLSNIEEELDSDIIQEIVRVDKGLAVAQDLLAQHVYSSRLFEFLENNTLETVQYNDFTYSFGSRSVILAAVADSYVSLNEQIHIFQNLPLIRSVDFSGISMLEDDTVGFSLNLTFNDNIFRFNDSL